ncbi:MAG: hypothetical protein ACJASX_004008, partial [Limisphaerales bacterium]
MGWPIFVPWFTTRKRINVLRKELLQQDISQRNCEDKFLQQVDAERVNNLLKRYSDLLEMKRKWSQELIRYEWTC